MTEILDCIVGYLAFFGITLFPLLLIHCFYDENLAVTGKKILAIALMPFLSVLIKIAPATDPFVTAFYVIVIPVIAVLGGKMTLFRRVINWSRYILTVIFVFIVIFPLQLAVSALLNFGDELYSNLYLPIIAVYTVIPSIIMYMVYIRKEKTLLFRRQDKLLVWLYATFVIFLYFADIDEQGNETGMLFNSPDNIKDYLLILFTIFMITFLPFFIIRNCQSSYYGRLSEHQQYFLEAELNASKQYKAAQEETRAFRHDVQNNLTAVAMLMEQKKYDEAEQYINDMRTEVSSFSPKVVTGDEMLDSLISAKLTKMAENRIKFKIDGVIDGGLGWKPMDICTVFANALDNAIEAASQVTEGEPRNIGINIKKTAHQRLISISNSCKEDIDCKALMDESLHFTSKADKRLHGFGMKNIQKVIEKNGGMMKINCENKRFSLDMILQRN